MVKWVMSEHKKSVKPRVVRVEHVDDIPVLLASMKQVGMVELLDRHFPTHHLWKGDLSFGEVVGAWITHIVSQGDHRLNHVEPWAELNCDTLQACLGKTVRALDFHDDRLADVLDALAAEQRWQGFENDLNTNTIRVYRLKPQNFRIDTTTASSYAKVADDSGIIQFGHSKDNDNLPQLKIAAAVLDPLGLPITTIVVPGNKADDPLYVPQMKTVNATFGAGGKTFFGDCKMGSLDTRAYVASTKDWYVCPLSEIQLSRETRLALLEAVFNGTQKLKSVYRPKESPEQEPELIAAGFSYDVALSSEVDERPVRWKERRWVVQSVALANSQAEKLDQRLEKAIAQLEQLHERKQGKKRLNAEELNAAAARIIENNRVSGLLSCRVRTIVHEKVVRGYGKRPQQSVRDEEHRLETSRQVEAIAQAKREMGWQVYATNNLKLNLTGVVLGYRGQYRIEDCWSRLKGRSLSLSPMYLAIDSRMEGLVKLLSLAVRALTLLEWVVRQKLVEKDETLQGVHPGQAGRKNRRPSAELLLRVFRGVSLTVVEVAGQQTRHVTPLTTLQQKLLELWDFPKNLFQRIALHSPKPPPSLSER
jgi:transposase